MKRQKQSGFAHLIIITVFLALGLVGALGYIYWQNFMQPKQKQSSALTNSSSTNIKKLENIKTTGGDIEKPKTKIETSDWKSYSKNGIEFKYPNDWNVVEINQPQPNVYTMSIQNQLPQEGLFLAPDGYIAISIDYFAWGYVLGYPTTPEGVANEAISERTDLAYFIKSMNFMYGLDSTTQENTDIGGLQAIRIHGDGRSTSWGVKTENGIYLFSSYYGPNVSIIDVNEKNNRILSTVKFVR